MQYDIIVLTAIIELLKEVLLLVEFWSSYDDRTMYPKHNIKHDHWHYIVGRIVVGHLLSCFWNAGVREIGQQRQGPKRD
jgi:hypothetical protein